MPLESWVGGRPKLYITPINGPINGPGFTIGGLHLGSGKFITEVSQITVGEGQRYTARRGSWLECNVLVGGLYVEAQHVSPMKQKIKANDLFV